MRRLKIATLAAALVCLCSVAALAQQPGGRPGFGPPRDPEKARERMELLTMWKMMEELDLSKETGEKVFEIRRKYIAERKGIEQQLHQDLDTLRIRLREGAASPDEKELAALIKSVRDQRKRLEGLQDRQYDEISKVLSVVQQANLLIFMKDFRDEIRGFIGRPMGQRHRPRMPYGGPPPGGPGPGTEMFGPPEE